MSLPRECNLPGKLRARTTIGTFGKSLKPLNPFVVRSVAERLGQRAQPPDCLFPCFDGIHKAICCLDDGIDGFGRQKVAGQPMLKSGSPSLLPRCEAVRGACEAVSPPRPRPFRRAVWRIRRLPAEQPRRWNVDSSAECRQLPAEPGLRTACPRVSLPIFVNPSRSIYAMLTTVAIASRPFLFGFGGFKEGTAVRKAGEGILSR